MLRPARAHFHPPSPLRARTCLAGMTRMLSRLLCFLRPDGARPDPARSAKRLALLLCLVLLYLDGQLTAARLRSLAWSQAPGAAPVSRTTLGAIGPTLDRRISNLTGNCGAAAPARALTRRSCLADSGWRAGTQALAVPDDRRLRALRVLVAWPGAKRERLNKSQGPRFPPRQNNFFGAMRTKAGRGAEKILLSLRRDP